MRMDSGKDSLEFWTKQGWNYGTRQGHVREREQNSPSAEEDAQKANNAGRKLHVFPLFLLMCI